MIVVETVEATRSLCDRARSEGRALGLVPTMGYFHEGHRSLMRAARAENDVVVVSLFVNPTQFGPDEDLSSYPRDLESDRDIAALEGVDVVFAPSVEEMYPGGPPRTTVHVEGLTADLCGRARPTHFDGVTTVVAKLFSIVGACTAYFGRKDYQQLAVVRQMTRDLDLPVEVRGVPLVREPDGLAMSSRNAYLSDEQRGEALVLSRTLRQVAASAERGERDARALEAELRSEIAEQTGVELEYGEVRDALTLEPVDRIERDAVIALAARVGTTRLIDNVVLRVEGGRVDPDLGVIVGREQV
jgi:pantoate--beta-alanine ligase